MKNLIPFIFINLVFSGCATVYESLDSTQSPLSYQESENSKGQTVYTRKTYENSRQTPSIQTPIPEQSPPLQYISNLRTEEQSLKRESTKTNTNLLLEFASGTDFTHLGLSLANKFDDTPVQARIGVSLFESYDVYYAGFDLGARLIMDTQYVQPFVGLGGYAGDNKRCENQTDQFGDRYEECTKKFLTAGYVEYGLQFEKFALFGREYKINDAGLSIPATHFWGINISF